MVFLGTHTMFGAAVIILLRKVAAGPPQITATFPCGVRAIVGRLFAKGFFVPVRHTQMARGGKKRKKNKGGGKVLVSTTWARVATTCSLPKAH